MTTLNKTKNKKKTIQMTQMTQITVLQEYTKKNHLRYPMTL